jgi:hypothetical protein
MASLIREKFNLQKVGFKNILVLVLLIVVFGLIGIIAKAITKDSVNFSSLSQIKLKAINISDAQACWDPPTSCAASSGSDSECAASSSSGDCAASDAATV